MADNGTGTFVRLYNWVIDKTNSVTITASRMDAEMDGMATALSNRIAKDGQTTVTADIPFNSHKLTGLAVGTARTDAITLGQVQDGQFTYLGTSGGSADAYTLTPSPAITAYVATMRFRAKIAATNTTTTPYLQISSIGTPASNAVIKKLAADKSEVAVVVGDIVANGIYEFQRNSGNTAWILLNPENPISAGVVESDLINNLAISTSVAANALTIALKTKTGNDPSTSEPVQISFRDVIATSGTYVTRNVTAATSVIASSGSTLGTFNGVAAKLYVYALDNAGTIELAVSSFLFPDDSLQSSTAEGGAGAADSALVLYSTTARSNLAIRLIGVIDITQATAGTWISNSTTITSNPSNNLIGYNLGIAEKTLISTATASNSATIDFINLTSSYTRYVIQITDLKAATDGVNLYARMSSDNGATFDSAAANYYYAFMNPNNSAVAAATQIQILDVSTSSRALGNAAGEFLNADIQIFNPSNASHYCTIGFVTHHQNQDNNVTLNHGSGQRSTAKAINGIRLFLSVGNITSGIFKLYGIR